MKLILILEDDWDRSRRFHSVVAERWPGATLKVLRTVAEFKAAYLDLLAPPELVCLDHDLFADSPKDPDPGDGREVARFLATRRPGCPVLIHSSNGPAADSMLYSLRDAGWTAERISPLGEDWIEAYWFPVARQMADKGNANP